METHSGKLYFRWKNIPVIRSQNHSLPPGDVNRNCAGKIFPKSRDMGFRQRVGKEMNIRSDLPPSSEMFRQIIIYGLPRIIKLPVGWTFRMKFVSKLLK